MLKLSQSTWKQKLTNSLLLLSLISGPTAKCTSEFNSKNPPKPLHSDIMLDMYPEERCDVKETTDLQSKEDIDLRALVPQKEGEKLANYSRELSDKDLSILIGIWESERTMTDLPEVVKTLINVAFYNAFKFNIPDDWRISIVPKEEYQFFFGDSAGMFTFFNKTIYVPETSLGAGFLGGITHEIGHALSDHFGIIQTEYLPTLTKFALLVKIEELLPPIPVAVRMAEVYVKPTGPELWMELASNVLYPFSSYYGITLSSSQWEIEYKLRNGDKLEAMSLESRATWILLGMSSNFEEFIEKITSVNPLELRKIAKTQRTDEEFYNLSESAIENLFQEFILNSKYGRDKVGGFILVDVDQYYHVSDILLLYYFSKMNNYKYFKGKQSSDKCTGFLVREEQEIKDCYTY